MEELTGSLGVRNGDEHQLYGHRAVRGWVLLTTIDFTL